MRIKHFRLIFVTLIGLALPFLVKAQATPDYLGKDGFPKLELLDADLQASHCFFLPEGWFPNAAGYGWVDEVGTDAYAPDASTCISYIRLGLAGLTSQDKLFPMIKPGSIFYDNKKGERRICHLVEANADLPIPDAISKTYGSPAFDKLPTDELKKVIRNLMSKPEIKDYLDKAMPLECLQLNS